VNFPHQYKFSPNYQYTLKQLLAIQPPEPPKDFAEFWQQRYQQALQIDPQPELIDTGESKGNYHVYDLYYQSTNNIRIGGWLLKPNDAVKQVLIIGHGYGGRSQPDWHWQLKHTALLFPCFRGISRSRYEGVSQQPSRHVLKNIQSRDDYIIGGCVDDFWLAVSTAQELFPDLEQIAYAGTSFGGGIGALAAPWDKRINKLHLNIPTFGHQSFRLQQPSRGSAEAVRIFNQRRADIHQTLNYYDAAIAARYINISTHITAACFDPMVPPPGQFAIYNAINSEKHLQIIEAGHFPYPNQHIQNQQRQQILEQFFGGPA
jgi:cephalosporin-C deacetylase